MRAPRYHYPWRLRISWHKWKISTIRFARENNIPFMGICLGLQLSVVEFARNVCGIADATSTEFENQEHHLSTISLTRVIRSQKEVLSGSAIKMRLLPKDLSSINSTDRLRSTIDIVIATKSVQINMKFFAHMGSCCRAHHTKDDSSNI